MAYRVYVSDALFYQAHLNRRYIDVVAEIEKPVEHRTAEEIITDIRTKINNLTEEGGL